MFSHKYYDYPEGQYIYKKVLATSKYALITAIPTATLDVILYSKPKTVFGTAYRFGFYVFPLVGMATAFTVTSNSLYNIRGKDDYINYFAGGAVAGSIAAAWKKTIVGALPLMIAFGVAACIKKMAIVNGVSIIPPINTATNTIQSVRHDFTYLNDIDYLKTWTTGISEK